MTTITQAPLSSAPTTQATTPDNSYTALFFGYVSRSLAEALTTVRTVATRLPDEDRVQACHVLDFGLRLPENWPQARDLTVALAPYVERSGEWETWRQQLQRALQLAEQQQDVASTLQLQMLAARLSQRQGRLVETIYAYRRVIRLARQTGNRFDAARACSNLGYIFIDTGRFGLSEILCRHALTIFTELQSNHGLAHTHNHLGLLYTRQKRYAEAEHHLQLACALWDRMQDNHSLFHGNVNLGLLCFEMDRLNEALTYLDLALQIAEHSGETVEIARVWNNLGVVYLKLRNFGIAASYLEKAYLHFSQITQEVELAKIHHNLGLTYQQLESWANALEHLEKALQHFQMTYNLMETMKVLIALTGQATNSAYAARCVGHVRALRRLVAQQHDPEFHTAFHTYVEQYCSSFLGGNTQKLLQLLAPLD